MAATVERGIGACRVPSVSDVSYAVGLAIAWVLTNVVMTQAVSPRLNESAGPVATLWAVISAVFVYKDTFGHAAT